MMSHSDIATIKSLLIADRGEDKVFFTLPLDLTTNSISEMKNIYSSFKDATETISDKGKVTTKNGYFYYYKLPSGLFYVVIANKFYKENILNEFIEKIDDSFIQKKKTFENGSPDFSNLSQQEKISLLRIFDKYKILTSEGKLDCTLDLEQKDYSNFFNYTMNFIETESNVVKANQWEGEVIIH